MENLSKHAIILIAAGVLTVCLSTTNVPLGNSRPQYRDTLSTGDFLKEVSADYSREFNLAKQAKAQTKISKIREYAVKVMDMCILANKDMQPFASRFGVTLADTASVTTDIKKAVSKKNSEGFDKNYLAVSMDNHQKLISNYEKAVLFKDTTIVNMAEVHLLVLRRNLEMAKFLSKNFKNGKLIADKPPKEE